MSSEFIPSVSHIRLDRPPFYGADFSPARVNFLYGENGTGKTTMAQAIVHSDGVSWSAGFSGQDTAVLCFNQEYVDQFFRREDRIPGIFSIQGVREEAAAQIRRAKRSAADASGHQLSISLRMAELKKTSDSLFDNLKKSCWKDSAAFRKEYSKAFRGFLNSSEKFTRHLLEIEVSSAPDRDRLRSLYDSAFQNDAIRYERLLVPEQPFAYRNLPGTELLAEPIVSASSDSAYADLIHKLHAASWVRTGKEIYLDGAAGRCPFCAQPLPADFRRSLASLFDERYEARMTALRLYEASCKAEMNRLYPVIARWTQHPFPGIADTRLPLLIQALRQQITVFLKQIQDKIAHPEVPVTAEDPQELLLQVLQEAEAVNSEIARHNAVVSDLEHYQKECSLMAWQSLAQYFRDPLQIYQGSLGQLRLQEQELLREKQLWENRKNQLLSQIRQLEEQTENSRAAMEEINALLARFRYQDFSLRQKEGADGLYEVVRADGQLADSLSEGEYRMLAFLYFCQQARKKGGWASDPEKSQSPRILVFDDPASGLDRRAKQVVSSMILYLASQCPGMSTDPSSGEELTIAQLFLFTHDIDFYRGIMDQTDQIPSATVPGSDFRSALWVQLRKVDGKTSLQLRT